VGCRNGCEATAGQAKRQANTSPGLLSPQPGGLKPFVDFCGVARSGETAAGIAQHSGLQKSATGFSDPHGIKSAVPQIEKDSHATAGAAKLAEANSRTAST